MGNVGYSFTIGKRARLLRSRNSHKYYHPHNPSKFAPLDCAVLVGPKAANSRCGIPQRIGQRLPTANSVRAKLRDLRPTGRDERLAHPRKTDCMPDYIDTPNTIDIYDDSAVETLRRQLRFDPYLIKRLRYHFWRSFTGVDAATQHFPANLIGEIRTSVRFHNLALRDRRDSQVDGASKLIFRTARDQAIETVILRTGTGRTTLCLSSQVGCAAACAFCATGFMGIAQNLTASEILDQIVQAGELLRPERRSPRNLVFMGMGEPFHNEHEIHQTLETLLSPKHFDWPGSRIMISTVGVTDAMIRCAKRFPKVKLALSLHSANQTEREKIIPLAKRYPLGQIRSTIEQLNELQPQPVMIEYLMLSGVNDAESDAGELSEFLAGLNVHVNLIPFNEIEDAPQLQSSSREVRDRFAGLLRANGFVATIRYSLGSDIDAACGQLVRKENRKRRS